MQQNHTYQKDDFPLLPFPNTKHNSLTPHHHECPSLIKSFELEIYEEKVGSQKFMHCGCKTSPIYLQTSPK